MRFPKLRLRSRRRGRPVEEHEARGDTARVYHEVRQTFRTTGVNLVFRRWATRPAFLSMLWDEFAVNAETWSFEEAADHVRSESVQVARALGQLDVLRGVRLGDSQRFQLGAALDLYHYVNPKLLVMVSAVRLALDGETIGGNPGEHVHAELIERGIPPRMAPMEMVAERPSERRIARLFDDIRESLGVTDIPSDYRTLALWPDYLEAAWRGLRTNVHTRRYRRAAEELRETARFFARALPLPLRLSKRRVEALGEDAEAIAREAADFEALLPSLILSISMLGLDFHAAEELERSPFPPALRWITDEDHPVVQEPERWAESESGDDEAGEEVLS